MTDPNPRSTRGGRRRLALYQLPPPIFSTTLLLFAITHLPHPTQAEPISYPYVAYRTNPTAPYAAANDRQFRNVTLDKKISSSSPPPAGFHRGRAQVRPVEVSPAASATGGGGGGGDPRCPLSLRVGLTHRTHAPSVLGGPSGSSAAGGTNSEGGPSSSGSSVGGTISGMHTPVITYPVHPSSGPGRNVIFATDWEHLDMLTPSVVQTTSPAGSGSSSATMMLESLGTDSQFPLLFEGSNFYHTTPSLHDENGDGIMDATLIDYDGGIYTVGLDYSPPNSANSNAARKKGRERYVKTAQVPRLYVRKDWIQSATNATIIHSEPADVGAATYQYPPYHSYFEYGTEQWRDDGHKGGGGGQRAVGKSGNLVEQSVQEVADMEERRVERWKRMEEEIMEEGRRRRKEEEERKKREAMGGLGNGNNATDPVEGAGAAAGEEEAGKEQQRQEEEAPKPQVVEGEGDAVRGDRRRRRRRRRLQEVRGGANHTEANVGEEEQVKTREVIDAVPVDDKDGLNNNADHQLDLTSADGDTTTTTDTQDGGQDDDKNKKPINTTDPHTNYCGDCYGAAEYPHECCNTCDDIRRLYRRKNWGFKNADFVQCVREGLINGTDSDFDHYDGGLAAGGGDSADYGRHDHGMYDDYHGDYPHDDLYPGGEDGEHATDDYAMRRRYGDDEYMGDDYYGYGRYGRGGDYEEQSNFYNDENYIRVPPHVLADPVHVEIPKRYKSANDDDWAVEEFLIVAVSYYMDEDEYDERGGGGLQSYRRFVNRDGGDETEIDRGQYVSSALLFWNRKFDQWSGQTHLDLSTDWTAPINGTVGDMPVHHDNHRGLGAFALASPTVVSFEDDTFTTPPVPKYCAIVGTSMGLLYVLEIPTGTKRDGFPVRFPYPIVRRAVVEDVVGDTKPEVFVLDKGGNLVCLDSGGETVWHRDLIDEERNTWAVRGTSEMTLGDVNGDGMLDVVVVVRLSSIRTLGGLDEMRIYALDAATGDDIPRFPLSVEVRSRTINGRPPIDTDDDLRLPQPLLVDLHADQDYWIDRVRRYGNATNLAASDAKSELEREAREVRKRNDEAATGALPAEGTAVPHGGRGRGLHIVQPIQSHLYIIEGGTGCTQTINIGDDVPTMVQVDDVHGTETLDLIVSTASGQVLTLEVSDAVPFHPLNVWNTGPVRSRINGHAQGYSATQGIFVHEKARRCKNWLGIYVTVTFEIFDRRPGIWTEPDARKYLVDVRVGTSAERTIMRQEYSGPGIYTERVFIPWGTGYYTLVARLTTTNGLVYEDVFSVGYNVNYTTGLAWVVFLPLILSAIPLLAVRRKPNWEEDDDFTAGGRGSHGILG